MKKSTVYKLLEGFAVFLVFLCFCEHLIGGVRVRNDFVVSFVLIAATGLTAFLKSKFRHDTFRLWAVFTALMAGFWVFNLLRFFGIVGWPLQVMYNPEEGVRLFFYHVVLVCAVIIPVFLVKNELNPPVKTGVGKIERPFKNVRSFLIWAGALGVTGWALWFVFRDIGLQEHFTLFLALIGGKALMTGFTEEFCYRGVIQKAATAGFGVWGAIVLQAVLYASFHLNLVPVFFPKLVFLMIVFGIGILFGWVSYITRGIGWAVLVHTAVDVVVEWNNIY